MPRKVRGRPVAYGPAQLRTLDKFLREDYLMHLLGDPDVLLKYGYPFHQEGNAFFDVDHLHVEFLKAHNYKVTARQTALAMAEIGVHRVQRRFENGTRMRCNTVPIPEGADCGRTSAEFAKNARMRADGWKDAIEAEPWIIGVEQFQLHGVCRRAIRFVKADFEKYPEAPGTRALAALFNDERYVVEEYFEQLRVEPSEPDLDCSFGANGPLCFKKNFWRGSFHSKGDPTKIYPHPYYEYLHDSIFDADLFEAPDKAKYLLEYFPDSHGGTHADRAKLLQLSNGLGPIEKGEIVALLQHLPAEVGEQPAIALSLP